MFDIGIGEVFVILVVALLVFGPDRLPAMAKQAATFVRDLRTMVANARRDLSGSVSDLGIDEDDLRTLSDLRNPRSFVRKKVLDGVDLGLDDLGIEDEPKNGHATNGASRDGSSKGTSTQRTSRTDKNAADAGDTSDAAASADASTSSDAATSGDGAGSSAAPTPDTADVPADGAAGHPDGASAEASPDGAGARAESPRYDPDTT